jgi:hypothetical protein
MRFFEKSADRACRPDRAAVGVAYLLPRNVIVEREVVVNAPPEVVFEHVNSLQAFSEWSPWGDYDPEMQVVYSGPESGVGNVMEWTSDHRNVGTRTAGDHRGDRERSRSHIDGLRRHGRRGGLVAPGARRRRDSRDLGAEFDMGNNPIGRWFGLMLDGFVGADYERGLAQLQADGGGLTPLSGAPVQHHLVGPCQLTDISMRDGFTRRDVEVPGRDAAQVVDVGLVRRTGEADVDVDILLLGEGHGIEKADGLRVAEVFSTENATRRCCSFSETKMPRSPSSSDRSTQVSRRWSSGPKAIVDLGTRRDQRQEVCRPSDRRHGRRCA